MLNRSFFLLLPLLSPRLAICDPPNDKDCQKHLNTFAFAPDPKGKAIGLYMMSNFDGVKLLLDSDGSFRMKTWGDVFNWREQHLREWYGKYSVRRDSLRLTFLGFILDPSQPDSTRRQVSEYLSDVLEYLSYTYAGSLFLKQDGHIYVVRPIMRSQFCRWMISTNRALGFIHHDGMIYHSLFPMKVEIDPDTHLTPREVFERAP